MSAGIDPDPVTSSNAVVPQVCCVVVNWNGFADTVECLRSLMEQDYPRLTVLVVDNASTDGSADRIREEFREVEVIAAGGNLGFGGGCNVGIRRALEAGADFVWLLNNDTVAPADTLPKLVAAGREKRVGIVGTVLLYLGNPKAVQAWGGGRVLRWMGYVEQFTTPSSFGGDSFLTFASALIRRELLLEIGLMDEGYFMYYDDLDFCLRARNAGWQLAVAEDTAVLHREGGSADATSSLRMERIVTGSGLRFLKLHAPIPWIAMTIFVGSRIGKRLAHGNFAAVRAVWMGVSDWRAYGGSVLPKDA